MCDLFSKILGQKNPFFLVNGSAYFHFFNPLFFSFLSFPHKLIFLELNMRGRGRVGVLLPAKKNGLRTP